AASDPIVLARTSPTAGPAGEPLAVALRHGAGRVVVLADSDLIGDDSLHELDHTRFWGNITSWAASGARRTVAALPASRSDSATLPEWQRLKAAVEELRLLQAPDGSVPAEGDHSSTLQQAQDGAGSGRR